MIIKLISKQVPKYWEIIKYATTTADEVDEKDLQAYLIELLHALLSDKAQCWMRLDEDRQIIALLITRIAINKITAKKSLYLQCVFSYSEVPFNIWREDFNLLVRYANQEDCQRIEFESRHPKIWEMVTSFGCKEIHRSFTYNIG